MSDMIMWHKGSAKLCMMPVMHLKCYIAIVKGQFYAGLALTNQAPL